MKKDLVEKGFKKKRAAKGFSKPWQWIFLIGIFSVAVAIGGLFAYNKQSPMLPIVSTNLNRLKTWMTERKKHIHQGIIKAKQLTVKKTEVQPEIHFEFYTALPNMQVTIPDSNEKNSQSAGSTVKIRPPMKNTIVSVDQLEQELSEEFNHSSNHTMKGKIKS